MQGTALAMWAFINPVAAVQPPHQNAAAKLSELEHYVASRLEHWSLSQL